MNFLRQFFDAKRLGDMRQIVAPQEFLRLRRDGISRHKKKSFVQRIPRVLQRLVEMLPDQSRHLHVADHQVVRFALRALQRFAPVQQMSPGILRPPARRLKPRHGGLILDQARAVSFPLAAADGVHCVRTSRICQWHAFSSGRICRPRRLVAAGNSISATAPPWWIHEAHLPAMFENHVQHNASPNPVPMPGFRAKKGLKICARIAGGTPACRPDFSSIFGSQSSSCEYGSRRSAQLFDGLTELPIRFISTCCSCPESPCIAGSAGSSSISTRIFLPETEALSPSS